MVRADSWPPPSHDLPGAGRRRRRQQGLGLGTGQRDHHRDTGVPARPDARVVRDLARAHALRYPAPRGRGAGRGARACPRARASRGQLLGEAAQRRGSRRGVPGARRRARRDARRARSRPGAPARPTSRRSTRSSCAGRPTWTPPGTTSRSAPTCSATRCRPSTRSRLRSSGQARRRVGQRFGGGVPRRRARRLWRHLPRRRRGPVVGRRRPRGVPQPRRLPGCRGRAAAPRRRARRHHGVGQGAGADLRARSCVAPGSSGTARSGPTSSR